MERFDKRYGYGHIILPLPRTNMMVDTPQGSDSTLSQRSVTSSVTSKVTQSSHGTTRTQTEDTPSLTLPQYHGAEAWWSVGEFLQQGVTHQSVGLSIHGKQEDETWDLTDSLADLYREVNKREQDAVNRLDVDNDNIQEPENNNKSRIDKQWIEQDTSNGFVRVFESDSENSRLFPSTLSTTAQKLCCKCGRPPNSLHVQLNGDIIRRLEPFDCPLAIQNEFLQRLGYTDIRKVQEMGSIEYLPWLVKFYAGKPISDSTYSRNQLSTYCMVRKGKLLHQWVRRLCVVSGTRLLIYRDKNKNSKPTIVQLAKGSVDTIQIKGYEYCLKLTSTLQGDRSVYLAFTDDSTFSKWIRKTKKATAKLPSKADLSNCHLEFLPETIFINEDLRLLNLRHNALKERPIEEDIYTIGWLDDLPRFCNLQSLNLADNDLHNLPVAVCRMKTLTELNIASNKLTEIPYQISELTNLQILHVHNNHISQLPDTMTEMRNLKVIVLAFNHFTTVPDVLMYSHNSQLYLESVIMAGNRVERLPYETLSRLQHIKKVDLRMNVLTLLPSETAKFHLLENVTHLDVRDNRISDLDVRSLKRLEYLNCERNRMHSLQINGTSLKNLFSSHNEIESFSINPKPEYLVNLEISHNKLECLPPWVAECFFMIKLDASHNKLKQLPAKLFVNAQKLKSLFISHNQLVELPTEVEKNILEEIHLQHNQLVAIPDRLILKSSKLRYLNLTVNCLTTVPQLHHSEGFTRMQELYMSGNQLGDEVIPFACNFPRLKILHIAYNNILEIHSRDVAKLEVLQELNVSGNYLRSLPSGLSKHQKLQVLRANSNLLKDLPDFKRTPNLKILEVGSNRLSDIPITKLLATHVNLLDISGNPNLLVDGGELRGISHWKKISMVDMRGQNRSILDLRQSKFDDDRLQWQTGLSQTSGIRNKLSIAILNKPEFNDDSQGLFGMFDGGRNDEVTKVLGDVITDSFIEESKDPTSQQHYMKYCMLAAHSKLKDTGQRVGASAVLCHIKKQTEGGNSQLCLNVANVGDTEIVMSRSGEAVPLSRLFLINADKEECNRICKSDGIITEDGRLSGTTFCTRMLGNSYLYPHLIPDPHVASINLRADDQLIIIANHGLWKYLSYQEAVDEIVNIPDPVVAAKRLQDLAQGYGSQESIGVLVVRLFLSDNERNRMKHIIQEQYRFEQQLISELKQRDAERIEERKRRRAEIAAREEVVNMEKLKLRHHEKKRKQANEVFVSPEEGGEEGGGEYVSLKSMNDKLSSSVDSTNWQTVLEQRLREEVKDRELECFFGAEEIDLDAEFGPGLDSTDSNWATGYKKNQTGRYLGDNRDILGGPAPSPCGGTDNFNGIRPGPIIEPSPSMESVEFVKEYKMPFNIDRDAVLFHQMQMTRSKSHTASSDSLDSTQSVPVSGSIRQVLKPSKKSSHSIEVLINRTGSLPRDVQFGGSLPEPEIYEDQTVTMEPDGTFRSHRRSKHGRKEDSGKDASDKSPMVDKISASEGKISKKTKPMVALQKSKDTSERHHQNLRLTKSDADKENVDLELVPIVDNFDHELETVNDTKESDSEEEEEKEEPLYVNHQSVVPQREATPNEQNYTLQDIVEVLKTEEHSKNSSKTQENVNVINFCNLSGDSSDSDIEELDVYKDNLVEPKKLGAEDDSEVWNVYTNMPNVTEQECVHDEREVVMSQDNDPAVYVFSMSHKNKLAPVPEEDTSVVSAYKDNKVLTTVKNKSPPLPTKSVTSKENSDQTSKVRKTMRAPSPPDLIRNPVNGHGVNGGQVSSRRNNGHNIDLAIEDLFAQIDKKRIQTTQEQDPEVKSNSLNSLKEVMELIEQQGKETKVRGHKSDKPRTREKRQAPDVIPVKHKSVKQVIAPNPKEPLESVIKQTLPEQSMIITYL